MVDSRKDEIASVPLDQKLRSEAQWRVWIGHIKSAAISEDTWDYIDIERSDEDIAELPTAQTEPTLPKDNRGREKDVIDLTDDELKRWNFSIQAYDRRETKRQRLVKATARINSLITRSLATEFQYLIVDEQTPRAKLLKLAETFKPKPENRRQELRRAWRLMIQPAKNVNIDQWLTQWEGLYEEGKAAEVPDCVKKEDAIRDFLDAVQGTDDSFCLIWRDKLRMSSTATFHEVIADYRSRRGDLALSTSKKHPKIAFATLDSQKEARPTGNRAYRTKCPCGSIRHQYTDCWYLDETIRRDGWQPREDIAKRIPEFIKHMSPEDQQKIRELRQKKRDTAQLTLSDERISMFVKDELSASTDHHLHPLKNSWILDSGTNCHISNDRKRFLSFKPQQGAVKTGDSFTNFQGIGTVEITARSPRTDKPMIIELKDVRYSPNFHANLVSHSKIEENGFWWDPSRHAIVHRASNKPVAKVESHQGLYTLEYQAVTDTAFATKQSAKPPISTASAERWHRRLGHAYSEKIELLPQMVDGVKIDRESNNHSHDSPERCMVCQLASARRQISRRPQGTTYGRFGRIHFDLVQIDTAYNGDRWLSHFYIDGIRLHAAYTHEKKNGCQQAITLFCAHARTQWSLPIRAFRYDNERSAGRTVEQFLAEQGFVIEHSVVGTPEQNGFAERSGGVIVTIARALLQDSGLPKNLWPEAIKAAVWIVNRSPTKLNGNWIVPYQEALRAYQDQPPRVNLANLRLYGCRAYVRKQGIPNASKMEPRAEIGYLVGYEASNIWRIWFPQKGAVRSVRDVIFDENRFFHQYELDKAPVSDVVESMPWNTEQEEDEIEETQPTIPLLLPQTRSRDIDTEHSQEKGSHNTRSVRSGVTQEQQVATPSPTPSQPTVSQPAVSQPPGTFPTSPRQDNAYRAPRDIDGDVSERNIIRGSRKRRMRDEEDFVSFQTTYEQDEEGVLAAFTTGLNSSHLHTQDHRDELPPEPDGWKEMMNHPYREGFLAACAFEIQTIERKDTYDVIQRPNDRSIQILPLRWVFSYKFDSSGYLSKLKARICVRGDLQKLTTEDKYAATLAARTARAVFSLVAAFDLDTYQYDAVNAFLNSLIDEEVITEMPEGFKQPGRCWKLKRALYGLRKSPRLWQREASSVLTSLGFTVVQEDLCVFVSDGIIIFFYVDDIIIVNQQSKQAQTAELREKLNQQWELRDIGEATWFLGIRIVRDRQQKALWLCQDSYISSMATRYHLTSSRRFDIPLPTEVLKPYQGEASHEQIHEYQQKVGSSQYATTITRPDAAKATAALAQYLTNPGPEHLEAINRVISYLYHTRSLALTYRPRPHREAEAVSFFSDASFADNPDRKSSEGYICQMFGGAVDWRAGKQRTVTTSTTEAELLALSETSKTIEMWKRLFSSIRFDPRRTPSYARSCDTLIFITTGFDKRYRRTGYTFDG